MAGFVYGLSDFEHKDGEISIYQYFSKFSDRLGNPIKVGFFVFDTENDKLLGRFGQTAANALYGALIEYFERNRTDGALIHGIDVEGLLQYGKHMPEGFGPDTSGYIEIDTPAYGSMKILSMIQKPQGQRMMNGMIPVKNAPEWLIDFELVSAFSGAKYSNALFYPSEEKFQENFLNDTLITQEGLDYHNANLKDTFNFL